MSRTHLAPSVNDPILTEEPPRPVRMRTASTRLNVNCGCGFKCADVAGAEAHSRLTGHTVHILGEVTSF